MKRPERPQQDVQDGGSVVLMSTAVTVRKCVGLHPLEMCNIQAMRLVTQQQATHSMRQRFGKWEGMALPNCCNMLTVSYVTSGLKLLAFRGADSRFKPADDWVLLHIEVKQ